MEKKEQKTVLFGQEALSKLKEGVDLVADAVKVTLGGRGMNALITLPTSVKVTKDGVTVANYVDTNDDYARQGTRLLKQVALGTNKEVGDGTTTSVVLAQAMINKGIDRIKQGANPILLQRGINKAVELVCEHLKNTAVTIKDDEKLIRQVATVSANNDAELGNIVLEAFKQVKYQGLVTFKESNTPNTYLEVVEGIKYDTGVTSPYFIPIGFKKLTLHKPYVLVTNKYISGYEDFGKGDSNLLQRVFKDNNKDLVIVCKDMDKSLERIIVHNYSTAGLRVSVVKAPYYGTEQYEALSDLAALLGTKLYAAEKNDSLEDVTFDDLGTCSKIEVTLDEFVITADEQNAKSIEDRKNELKSLISQERKEYAKKELQNRLMKLSSGLAVIYVGAKTEVEAKEKIDRVEDSINSVKSAIEGGILPGGGIALLQTSVEPCEDCKENTEFYDGFDIVNEVLEVPFKTIVNNAGLNANSVKKHIEAKGKRNVGCDVINGDIVDMYEAGIIDPAKVTISALQNATSVATTLLTTGCLVTERGFVSLDGI
jgi:60 kDa chaperonin|nr:MAG TPA: GroEL [Caudoviricetes sp.]